MRIQDGCSLPQPFSVTSPAAQSTNATNASSGRSDYYRDLYERLPANPAAPPPPGTPPPTPTAVDLSRPPAGSELSASAWHHLRPEDRQAVWDDYLKGSTNPKLAAFLGQHPDMVTNQDFIDYFWLDEGATGRKGWDPLAAGCAELGIKPSDVLNYRSAPIRDLAYPPPLPDGSLPLTAEEARRYHIVQVADPTYNPTGPSSSVNCGPASLAMALDTQGLIPTGLTPEQKVDYARALMYGTHNQQVEVRGQTVFLLDQDHATTDNDKILTGATAAGLTAQQETGWAELDAALTAGKPVVAYGDLYPSWRKQFAGFEGVYHGGEIAHFIAILGKTQDGAYIVDDPMFSGGPVEMTRDQLAVFFSKDADGGDKGDNTPAFVSMDPVKPPVPLEAELQRFRYQMR